MGHGMRAHDEKPRHDQRLTGLAAKGEAAAKEADGELGPREVVDALGCEVPRHRECHVVRARRVQLRIDEHWRQVGPIVLEDEDAAAEEDCAVGSLRKHPVARREDLRYDDLDAPRRGHGRQRARAHTRTRTRQPIVFSRSFLTFCLSSILGNCTPNTECRKGACGGKPCGGARTASSGLSM